jgi:predicted alpha/beta hydrolase family esterase
MRNAIILHGRPDKAEYYDLQYPSLSNDHWLPWLQKRLIVKDIAAVTPEVPLAYDPVWERWCREVERYEIGLETMLVGHSCGAGFWVRWLSERPDVRVGKVVLVAPWIDVEQQEPNKFFDFMIDANLVRRTAGMTIFHSADDQSTIQSSVKKLRETLPDVAYREFKNYGHFTMEYMGTPEFPELLEELLS